MDSPRSSTRCVDIASYVSVGDMVLMVYGNSYHGYATHAVANHRMALGQDSTCGVPVQPQLGGTDSHTIYAGGEKD